MSDASDPDLWRGELFDAAINFATLTAELHRRKPTGEKEPTLELIVETLVSWWIDHGFSKQQIVTALRSAAESPELEFEGWLSRVESDA
ncbi:MAG TPA: hypothetical protein VNZ85_17525 [Caulobacter sp.]|nr:hypothetical protein [Caulobacter sp.]